MGKEQKENSQYEINNSKNKSDLAIDVKDFKKDFKK